MRQTNPPQHEVVVPEQIDPWGRQAAFPAPAGLAATLAFAAAVVCSAARALGEAFADDGTTGAPTAWLVGAVADVEAWLPPQANAAPQVAAISHFCVFIAREVTMGSRRCQDYYESVNR